MVPCLRSVPRLVRFRRFKRFRRVLEVLIAASFAAWSGTLELLEPSENLSNH
jgi:hypothetical protein